MASDDDSVPAGAAPRSVTDDAVDVAYLRKREREERDAAAASSCMVRATHLDLAEAYADEAELRAAELRRAPAADR